MQSPTTASPAVDDHDRLGFTIVMALGLHALVIFGLGFDVLSQHNASKLIEVTLTQFKNDEAPEHADFLAQHHQQGSGTLDESAQLASPLKSLYQDNIVREIQLNTPTVIDNSSFENKQVLLSESSEHLIYADTTRYKTEHPHLEKSSQTQLLQQNLEIASLQARLAEQKQLYAKGPKVRQITSVSAKAADDAAYIHSFREKVEYMGNKYYPHEARQQGYEGEVQLLVAIRKDGHVERIELLKSSNNPVLDRAAINSVKLAAPFSRFTHKMRETTDTLEIIRTWQFRRKAMSTYP